MYLKLINCLMFDDNLVIKTAMLKHFYSMFCNFQVCYYGQHYHCFAYSHDQERWIMYDDKTVKVKSSKFKMMPFFLCYNLHLMFRLLVAGPMFLACVKGGTCNLRFFSLKL